MKKLSLFLVISLFPFLLISQANLEIPFASFSPGSINKYELLIVNITVRNSGNANAGVNYLNFYLSENTNITSGKILSRVSIEPLSPGASTEVEFVYPIPFTIDAGNYFIGFDVDAYDWITETNENNAYYHPTPLTINNAYVPNKKIPYPIIYVHGWTSNSGTWNELTDAQNDLYGWTNGGRMDFCLNADSNNSTGLFSTDYLDFTNPSTDLNIGDYYYVNFDVDPDGTAYLGTSLLSLHNSVNSNEAAIFKQGRAIRDAIGHVLQVTGSEKVILVGHSMGGLASREYLQNPDIWQNDNQHHVAKLLTIGTPHQGSNEGNLGIFPGDQSSEAIRDLRTSYFLGGQGVYLFGGIEDPFVVTGFPFGFDNVDINCNGNDNDDIVGLNEKIFPDDINYTAIIGEGNINGGDGAVTVSSANINNVASVQADTFMYSELTLNLLHSILQKRPSLNMKGIDTPYDYDKAYQIELPYLNYGLITKQSVGAPFTIDYDEYKFQLNENGTLRINVVDIPVNVFGCFLLDESLNYIEEIQSFGRSNIDTNILVSAGEYYIEMAGIPTNLSWQYPYGFNLNFTPTIPLVADFSVNQQQGCSPMIVNFNNQSTGNIDSYEWTFDGGTPATSSSANPQVTYSNPGSFSVSLTVTDVFGNVTKMENNFIVVNTTPVADFDFTSNDATVSFQNNSIDADSYFWDFGDGNTSSNVLGTVSHTYSTPGVYTVTLTATNECGSINFNQEVNVQFTSLKEIAELEKILIYPNPSDGQFTVEVKGTPNDFLYLRCYNVFSQEVYSNKISFQQGGIQEVINLENISSGTYLLKIERDGKYFYKKIILGKK